MACLTCTCAMADDTGDVWSVSFAPGKDLAEAASVESDFSFPDKQARFVHIPKSSWIDAGSLDFDLYWPPDAGKSAQVIVYLKDWDYFWYQTVLPGYLKPGETNSFTVDFSPTAGIWHPVGHHSTWHLRALMKPREVGVRVFDEKTYSGSCMLSNARVTRRKEDHSCPVISRLRMNRTEIPCYDKMEITFSLPDRYADPFDAEVISAYAEITPPEGDKILVDAYYGREYYRLDGTSGDKIVPQGPPYWRVRFAPVQEGHYSCVIHARDKYGEAMSREIKFKALPAVLPGFVRVSKKDPRYFEFDNGDQFFPVGHNVRSPFDARMNKQFPWTKRWPEGADAYARYFKDMSDHGETLVEIWTAAWSLGLEWIPMWPGYHGIGQFNMINSWELDWVIDEAYKRGLYINLVVHNHGKFSAFSDGEWEHNPFNVKNGGYLRRPDDYFTDPRAIKSFQKLMRYMVARWGYSTRVFSWEFWSELNLTGQVRGGRDGVVQNYKKPAVVDWHRDMGRWIKKIDPYDHMISTHVSSDYRAQNLDIVRLPEMDWAPVDAYHNSPNALHIVGLINETAQYNNPFGKPVMVTEFGGSAQAASTKHLRDSLHAALWSSACGTLGGTPMFWWWQLVEERQFYPQYSAISRYLKDEDRRDPNMVNIKVRAEVKGFASSALAVQCLAGKRKALGWIYATSDFSEIDPEGDRGFEGVVVRIPWEGRTPARAEFWDTLSGQPIKQVDNLVSEGNSLRLDVPAFARDIAFKVKLAERKKE